MSLKTIILVVASILVVGGAAVGIGIPLSDMLNGSSSGNGGDDVNPPSPPDEPEEPEDPETPTEPETSKSSVTMIKIPDSSSSSKPVVLDPCPKCGNNAWGTYTHIANQDSPAEHKHKRVCGKCQYEDVKACAFSANFVYNGDKDNTHKHAYVCSVCKFAKDEAACSLSAAFTSDGDGSKTHSKKCSVCHFGKSEVCSFSDGFTSDGVGSKTHSKKCSVCGQRTEGDTCTFTQYILDQSMNGYHTAECETMGCTNKETVQCIPSGTFTSDGDGSKTHSKKCSVCDRKFEKTNCNIEGVGFTSDDNNKHSKKCPVCAQKIDQTDCAAESTFTSDDNSRTHSKKCTGCERVIETKNCDVSSVDELTHNDDTTNGHFHSKKCPECQQAIGSSECTLSYTYDLNAATQTHKCSVCDYQKILHIVAAVVNDNNEPQSGHTTVGDAITAAGNNKVLLLADMTAASPATISKGKKVTINPNKKAAFLNYEDKADIQILAADTGSAPTSLGLDSAVKVGEMIMGWNNTAVNGLLVVSYEIDNLAVPTKMNIYDKDGLFAFAKMVNTDGKGFMGATVKLMNNIDLNNEIWTPVGQTVDGKKFAGTFDGDSHTIFNLYIKTNDVRKDYDTGFFGYIEPAVIKNVKVDVASVYGHHCVAVIVGYMSGQSIVESCEVTNAKLYCHHDPSKLGVDADACGDKCGVIVGQIGGGPQDDSAWISVKSCKATACTVNAGRDAGQIVGAAVGDIIRFVDVDSCSATNVVVSATKDCFKEGNINNAIIGRT